MKLLMPKFNRFLQRALRVCIFAVHGIRSMVDREGNVDQFDNDFNNNWVVEVWSVTS